MWGNFAADVHEAARMVVRLPLITLITIALAVAALPAGPAAVALFPIALFGIGWQGTQQLAAARLVHGDQLAPNQLWLTTWRYLGRYFLMGLFYIPVVAVAVWAVLSDGIEREGEPNVALPIGTQIFLTLLVVAMEILLTFVFPALALSTRKISQAWRIGWDLLTHNWRRDAWYAIAPAVTLQSSYTFIVPLIEAGPIVDVSVSLGLALLALIFRIAITREYVRLMPVTGRQPF